MAASHRAREVSPLRISPEGRRWPRTGGGPKCASMHYFASAFRPGCLWWSSGGGIAAQRADRIRRSFVLLKRCCALHRLALLAPARTARPLLQHSLTPSPHAVAARRRVQYSRTSTPKKNTAAKKRDEDKCPQLHSCVSYEHRVCRDRTGQANPSACTADPVQCYPSSPSPWAQSVVKGGGERPSGVHMSDGAGATACRAVLTSPAHAGTLRRRRLLRARVRRALHPGLLRSRQ